MISDYIESKKFAWAPSTIKSETSRLMSVCAHIDGNPEHLWTFIRDRAPYTRLTIWTRVTEYWSFCEPDSRNPYKQWKIENARLFKHTYRRYSPNISFNETDKLIKGLPNSRAQNAARFLLVTGLRVHELPLLNGSNIIKGKGGRPRRIYVPQGYNVRDFKDVSYTQLYRLLKRIGLKPHDLRKIYLTRLVNLGMNNFDLCEVAGWSSVNTAASYIRANNSNIENIIERL